MSDLWWISWEQEHDPAHPPKPDEDGDIEPPDPRPVAWPPPASVLAFWESGFAGDGSMVTVVAIARADSADAARAVVTAAWSPGVGRWRFVDPLSAAPSDRFPPPKWSVEMGRWPWPVAEGMV